MAQPQLQEVPLSTGGSRKGSTGNACVDLWGTSLQPLTGECYFTCQQGNPRLKDYSLWEPLEMGVNGLESHMVVVEC